MLGTIVNFCATESSLMWPPEAKKETLLYVMVLQLFYAKALFPKKAACSISLKEEEEDIFQKAVRSFKLCLAHSTIESVLALHPAAPGSIPGVSKSFFELLMLPSLL